MRQYPIRVGRPAVKGAKKTSRSRRAEDTLFFRAAVLALCGAAAVVSFLSFSAARAERDADYDRAILVSSRADGAIAAAAEEGEGDFVRSSAESPDGSVWSYIESIMRRLLGNESD